MKYKIEAEVSVQHQNHLQTLNGKQKTRVILTKRERDPILEASLTNRAATHLPKKKETGFYDNMGNADKFTLFP